MMKKKKKKKRNDEEKEEEEIMKKTRKKKMKKTKAKKKNTRKNKARKKTRKKIRGRTRRRRRRRGKTSVNAEILFINVAVELCNICEMFVLRLLSFVCCCFQVGNFEDCTATNSSAFAIRGRKLPNSAGGKMPRFVLQISFLHSAAFLLLRSSFIE
jgi:hypothetical protein